MNKGSTHTNATFNAIPSGIFYRLAKIASRTKINAQMKIDERYQGHAKALSKAGMSPKVYPTLNKIWKKVDASKMNNDAKRDKRSGGRELSTYFCIGFSKIWRENIYNIIKKICDSNSIKWLCTRMSYHRFSNLGELLQGDLVSNTIRSFAS